MDQDLSNSSKEELIQKIVELEDDLKRTKKYGLVWDKEKNPEAVVETCKTKIPVINFLGDKQVINGGKGNVIIEGDNFHSLTALSCIYQNSIDLIYIDPPYNTLNKDFVYNDICVDLDDGYRHSKWLSFMHRRLVLARGLLKDDGLFFVSIDENEQANLKILCDSVFGERHFICCFIIDKTAQGANQSVSFKQQHEYCLLYAKNSSNSINTDVEDDIDYKKFKYKDNKGYYAITNSFDSINSPLSANKKRGYTVYYNEATKDALIRDEFDPVKLQFGPYDEDLISKGYTPIRPGIRKGVQYPWNWERNRFLSDYKEELVFIKNRKGVLSIYHKNRAKGKTKDTTIKRFDTRQFGNQMLVDILGSKKFDYPKSVDMMKWVVSKHKSKEALILDFFAGSGTTGQAVLQLNKEDGGNRRFILCTNNENNICSEVAFPRLKTIITGIRPDGTKYEDAISGSLFYGKTGFVLDSKNREQAKYSLVEKCNGLLSILEDCFILKDKAANYYEYSDCNDKRMFIYNDFYSKKPFDEMKEKIKKETGKKILYIFSTDDDLSPFDLSDLTDVEVKPIPTKIYEIYKEIVEDIKRGE